MMLEIHYAVTIKVGLKPGADPEAVAKLADQSLRRGFLATDTKVADLVVQGEVAVHRVAMVVSE